MDASLFPVASLTALDGAAGSPPPDPRVALLLAAAQGYFALREHQMAACIAEYAEQIAPGSTEAAEAHVHLDRARVDVDATGLAYDAAMGRYLRSSPVRPAAPALERSAAEDEERTHVVAELRQMRAALNECVSLDALDEDKRGQAIALGVRIDALLLAAETPDQDELAVKLAELLVRTGLGPEAITDRKEP